MPVLHSPPPAGRAPPGWRRRRLLRGPWADALRELRLDLLALLWPTECVACGAVDRDCCRACLNELRCHREPLAGPVLNSTAFASARVRVLAAGEYSGTLRALLVACKHAGRTGFARLLGECLAVPLRRALGEAPGGGGGMGGPGDAGAGVTGLGRDRRVLLVAAPSRSARVRERGYRHVELLVREALRVMRRSRDPTMSMPASPRLLKGALRALPGRVGQVGLRADERRRNAELVAVRLRSRWALVGARVVLVDDVVTTGATVTAAAEALAAAGAQVVGVIALCSVVRRDEERGE